MDVSDYVENLRIRNSATDILADCSIQLDNPKGKWNDLWDGGEEIIIKMDYSDGTTNQFVGKLDNPSRGFNGTYVYRVNGRSYPELVDNFFIGDFDEEPIADAIKAVIDDLNNKVGYTVISYSDTSIESTEEVVSNRYREMNYQQVLKDLAKRADFDFYVNFSGELQAFKRGSKTSTNTYVTMGSNVLDPSFFTKDNTEVRNVEKVYGNNKEGCLIMDTQIDNDSINNLWRKERITNDTSIESVSEAKNKAASELTYDAVKIRGNPTILGEPNLIPGYKMDIFLPYIFEGQAILMQYNHSYSVRGGWETDLTFERRARTGTVRFAETDKRLREQQSYFNPNSMLYSAHFTFDDDSQIADHSNTETKDGNLKLITTGGDKGTTLSIAFDSDVNVSAMELRIAGQEGIDITTFRVSADDAANLDVIVPGRDGEPGTPINITNTGRKVRVEIEFHSDAGENEFPLLGALSILWK